MGWSLSPHCFQQLTYTFVKHFRRPSGVPPTQLRGQAARRWLQQRTRSHGTRLLPFVDDFACFKEFFQAAVTLRDHVFATLQRLGLAIHPTKGYHVPVQLGDHLGLTIDLQKGEFRAPAAKQP